jgi:hypothetical protein
MIRSVLNNTAEAPHLIASSSGNIREAGTALHASEEGRE